MSKVDPRQPEERKVWQRDEGLLCIGGVLDGQRIKVPRPYPRIRVKRPHGEFADLDEYDEYRIEFWAAPDFDYCLWVEKSLSVDDAFQMLVEGYRCKTSTPNT